MNDTDFLKNLGFIISAAAFFLAAGRLLRLPSIVSFLLAGLFLGPFAGIIEESESLDTLSEAGIVLLLFLVGLELTVDRIRDVGTVALLAGTAQIVITCILGFGISYAMGFNFLLSVLLAASLTISSTVVVVTILVKREESSSGHGQAAIGILLVQDIFVILLLTVVTGFGGGEEADAAAIGWSLAKAFGGIIALMGIMVVVSRYILPQPFAWAGRSRETIFIWSLSWCFLVVMGGHHLHLSHEIGAFLAGVSLAQFPHSHDLQRRVRPLMNFFVAVFFVTLGIGMKVDVSASVWGQALLFSLFVLVGKFLIILFIAARLRFDAKRAFFTALLLTQISEFSFILASVARNSGLPVEEAGPLLGLVGMITISLSSFLIGSADLLFRLAMRWNLLRKFPPSETASSGGETLSGHIIIVGMNTMGRDLAKRLSGLGETVVAVDTDPYKLRNLPAKTIQGDAEAPAVLKEAGLSKAKLLISTMHIEPTNDLLAFRCRVEGIPAAIHAVNLNDVANLLEMEVAFMISARVDGIQLQNAELKARGMIQA